MATNNVDPNTERKADERIAAQLRAKTQERPTAAPVSPLEDARSTVAQAEQSVQQRNEGQLVDRVMASKGIPRQHAPLARSLLLDYAYVNGLRDEKAWEQHEPTAAEYVDLGLRKSGLTHREMTAEQVKRNLEHANMSDVAWRNYTESLRRGR